MFTISGSDKTFTAVRYGEPIMGGCLTPVVDRATMCTIAEEAALLGASIKIEGDFLSEYEPLLGEYAIVTRTDADGNFDLTPLGWVLLPA